MRSIALGCVACLLLLVTGSCLAANASPASDAATQGEPPGTACLDGDLADNVPISDCDAALAALSSFDDARRALVLNNRAILLAANGADLEALTDYDAALSAQPYDHEIMVNRATHLYRMRRFADALAGFAAAITASNGNSARAYYNRTFVHRALGDVASAERDLNRARELLTPEQAEPIDLRVRPNRPRGLRIPD